jgi:putative MATE family efflux protein
MALLAFTLLRPVLGVMDLPPRVEEQAASFTHAILAGLPFIYLFYAIDAVYRGFGNTRTPMQVDLAAVVLNAILVPCLMHGWGPLPAMGVAGAGAATAICHACGFAAKLALARGRGIEVAAALGEVLRARTLDGGVTPWRIGRVGLPVAFTGLWICAVFIALTRLLAHYGTAPLAALTVGHRLESVPYFACVGFSGAAAALVGQNLGAGRPGRAERAAWGTVGYCAILIACVCLVYFFLPHALMRLFTDDPAVIELGVSYLKIVAVVEVFMGVELVLIGALSGAGDTAMPMVITSLFAAARVPSAALLAGPLGFGVQGVWIAIGASVVVRGALMTLWFRTGRWKTRRLVSSAPPLAPDVISVGP